MTFPELIRTDGTQDPLHQRLRKAVEKRRRAHLWVPADAISFIPRLLPVFYGDGRALFTIATINQRPAYWIIRGCSTWGCGYDRETTEGLDFGEFTEEIMTDLEDAFGRGRCGYSGESLFWPRRERIKNCQCEECSDTWRAKWPAVDDNGGCSWSRFDWPKGFDAVANPIACDGSLLAIPAISVLPALTTPEHPHGD